MTRSERLGLEQLQAQHPDKHVYIDGRGVATIEPIDSRYQRRPPEVDAAMDAWRQEMQAGLGQSSLLQWELDKQGV